MIKLEVEKDDFDLDTLNDIMKILAVLKKSDDKTTVKQIMEAAFSDEK